MTLSLRRIGRILFGWLCACLTAMGLSFLVVLGVGGMPQTLADLGFILAFVPLATLLVASPALIVAFILDWLGARSPVWPMLGGAACVAAWSFGAFLMSAAESMIGRHGQEMFTIVNRAFFAFSLFFAGAPIAVFSGYVHWRVAIRPKIEAA